MAVGALEGTLLDLLESLDYLAITLLLLLCPPLPSELALPLSGFYVEREGLSLPLGIAAATLGALGHALGVYGLARWGRRALGDRARSKRIATARRWFERRSGRVVFFGRMLSGARWLVGIPAGATRMPLRRYVPLTVAGCSVWATALMTAGWALGSAYSEAGGTAKAVSLAILVGLVAVLVSARVWRRIARTTEAGG
jgi:membrane protein DedA with SNARE-associated domain